ALRWIRLGRILLSRCRGSRVWRTRIWGSRISLLRRIAPGGRRWHAGLAGSWPALGRWHRVLAGRRRWLPGWHLPWHRRPVGLVRGRDRPLLVRRDVRGGWSLENGLAAAQQVEQPALVDVQVAGQARLRAGREGKLATLELPQEVEGLSSSPDASAAGMRQGPGLEGVNPVPARLSQFTQPPLAAAD